MLGKQETIDHIENSVLPVVDANTSRIIANQCRWITNHRLWCDLLETSWKTIYLKK
jgi:hypothetical protein